MKQRAILLFTAFLISGAPISFAEERYEAEVPDTLDLAERGALALNALTSCVDPNDHYNMYFLTRLTADPPYMIHMDIGDFLCCQPKWLEPLPMLRAMSGSEQNMENEKKMMGAVTDMLSPEDGLFYLAPENLEKKPWYKRGNYTVINEPVTTPFGNARLMLAMAAWYERDGDKQWQEMLQKAARGLKKIVIDKGDYAYYPEGKVGMEFAYLQTTGYNFIEEPKGEHEGGEGTVMCYQGAPIRALARWNMLSGDRDALELAGKLTRFVMMDKMWGTRNGGSPWSHEKDHAHIDGHHHGTCVALRGILEYAHAANDPRALEFARDGYEFARNRGIGRIGAVGDQVWKAQTEVCSVADLVALAIRLSDYGVGDYWDDADQFIRNHLVESQFVDIEKMRAVGRAAVEQPEAWKDYVLPEANGLGRGPDQWDAWAKNGQIKETRDVLNRNVGNFAAFLLPSTIPYPGTSGCCAGNAAQALYYAWESIVRCKDGAASVNLLLNRASPWLDVASYLPYEGKVVIRNKTATSLSVRMPKWVDRKSVKCQIGDKDVKPFFTGNYLVFGEIAPKDVITIQFPMVSETVKMTMPYDKQYSITFKGNTVVDIAPRDTNPTGYQIYQREHYKGDKAPMVKKTQYVADFLPNW